MLEVLRRASDVPLGTGHRLALDHVSKPQGAGFRQRQDLYPRSLRFVKEIDEAASTALEEPRLGGDCCAPVGQPTGVQMLSEYLQDGEDEADPYAVQVPDLSVHILLRDEEILFYVCILAVLVAIAAVAPARGLNGRSFNLIRRGDAPGTTLKADTRTGGRYKALSDCPGSCEMGKGKGRRGLVNRHWAHMFKQHLWYDTTLPSTITLTENKVDAILKNRRCIRSLTVAAQYIEPISTLGLTSLQELVLYDQDFEVSYIGDPVIVDTVIYMIDSNKSLRSLAIDLNHYNYESQRLAPALLLAIAHHPSLTKLTWHIPNHVDTRAFIQCIFHVCHDSIQELHLTTKRDVFIYGNVLTRQAFTHEDFSLDQNVIKRGSKDKALLQKLKMPIDQVEDPFKLKTLWLCIKPRQDILHPFLRNCPQLESIKIDDLFDRETHAQMPQLLAHSCPLLRGLDLRNAWEAGDAIGCSNQLGRFSQLQRVYIPCTDYRVGTDQSHVTRGAVHASVKIYASNVHPRSPDHVPAFERDRLWDATATVGKAEGALQLQSKEDLESEDAIAQDWDLLQGYRPFHAYSWSHPMEFWWYQWTLAKAFMKRVQGAYGQSSQERELPPIRMKYMYPIKHFVPRDEAVAYATRTGAWADGRLSWTIEDVSRIMGRKSLHDLESRREDSGQVTETVPEATLIAKIAKSVMGWCRQWAPMFAPHLWRTMRLPSTVIPAKDRIGAILESKHWIRSVTVAAQHIEQVSSLGLITLQELVMYDQDFQVSYTGDPIRVDAVIFMISSNKSLWSLAINLNHYNYESKQLTPSLMLAIARHPSLTKLTWHIPDDLDTRAFVKCLLHVCHTSIHELHLVTKRNVSTYGFRFNTCPAFTQEDFNDQNVIKRGSEYETLLRRLELPIDQLEKSFKLKTLWLCIKPYDDILPFLRNCPQIEDVRIDLSDRKCEVSDSGSGTVQSLVARGAVHVQDGASASNVRPLSPDDIPTFEGDRLWDETAQGALHLQRKEDLESEDAITEDWDPWQVYRPLQPMDYWWSQWTLAKAFMKRVKVAYELLSQKRELRPIHMKYMYPIKHFVPRDEAEAYANRTGAWADGRRSWTIKDARRVLKNGHPQPAQETMMSKIVTLFTEWWR
ncbi:MAG: hypothetical protein BYD32DRAFT_452069 [Podila humilis]|nr:MAG: hypothetical protein BYD32DRAFT_452069 [Podila humilis]